MWMLTVVYVYICGTNVRVVMYVSEMSDATSSNRGAQTFGISGPHWEKKSCLGAHVKYTNTNEN